MIPAPDGVDTPLLRQGRWLFHRRSYVGIALLPFLGLALWLPGYPGAALDPGDQQALSLLGLAVSMCGLLLRAVIVATVPADTSRRSTRVLQAQTLNTHGMYSLVRHPLYLANLIVASGFVIAVGSLWFMVVFQLAHAWYIRRILACEDAFLSRTHAGPWQAWASRTPALFPRHLRWSSPRLPWSIRTILRREYNSVVLLTTAYFTLELVRATLVQGKALPDWLRGQPLWSALFLAGLLVMLVLRTLKRRTRLLHVTGR